MAKTAVGHKLHLIQKTTFVYNSDHTFSSNSVLPSATDFGPADPNAVSHGQSFPDVSHRALVMDLCWPGNPGLYGVGPTGYPRICEHLSVIDLV